MRPSQLLEVFEDDQDMPLTPKSDVLNDFSVHRYLFRMLRVFSMLVPHANVDNNPVAVARSNPSPRVPVLNQMHYQ